MTHPPYGSKENNWQHQILVIMGDNVNETNTLENYLALSTKMEPMHPEFHF